MVSHDNIELLLKQMYETMEMNDNVPILVEGRMDVLALRKLGFKGEIIHLPKNMTIVSFSHTLSTHNEIILLMDWDRKGKRLTSLLTKNLESIGIHVDIKLWKLLNSISSDASNVESLPAFMEKLGYL